MAEALDYKKEFPDLYQPGREPKAVRVPEMPFLAVDGAGEPGGTAYTAAMEALYALIFTVKMSKMGAWRPDGYFDFVVPPLEGLWWGGEGKLDPASPRGEWRWTSMLRAPEYVNEDALAWAKSEARRKKPALDTGAVRLLRFAEGLVVQALHVGPYAAEPETIGRMQRYIGENGLFEATGAERRHHEIYLSDPRRTAPDRLKTILRLPVEICGR